VHTEVPHSVADNLLGVLFTDHADALLAYTSRLTWGDRAWAEDVVQEVLLRAWQNAGRLDPEGIRPWLYTVAKRLVIDTHRKRLSRPREVSPALTDQLPVPDRTEGVLLAELIRQAFRLLSAEHREILIELYFHGRTTNQAALSLGIPPGTARSRSYYAISALRAALIHQGVTAA